MIATPALLPTSISIVSGSLENTNSSVSAKIDITKPVQVACKTGTAESFGEGSKPHAWFTVFAPLEGPEIVLTVLVEEGGEGSEVAAPIAKEILTSYFEKM